MPEKFDSRVGGGKEMDPNEALYFAESPDEGKLEGFTPEQQKQIVVDALSEATHENMASGAEILRIALNKRIINIEDVAPMLIQAIAANVESIKHNSVGPDKQDGVIRSLVHAHRFLGNTLEGIAGTSIKDANEGQTDNYKQARAEKKGIFGW